MYHIINYRIYILSASQLLSAIIPGQERSQTAQIQQILFQFPDRNIDYKTKLSKQSKFPT